jgi:hypothetical protein
MTYAAMTDVLRMSSSSTSEPEWSMKYSDKQINKLLADKDVDDMPSIDSSFAREKHHNKVCVHIAPDKNDEWDNLVEKLPQCTKIQLLNEIYLDTKDKKLSKNGWLYSVRDGQERLTKVRQGDHFGIVKCRMTYPVVILLTLEQLLGKDESNQLERYATFTTRRYTFGNSHGFMIDVYRLPNRKIDVVLRLVRTSANSAVGKTHDPIGVVTLRNSKIMEYIQSQESDTSPSAKLRLNRLPDSLARIWNEMRDLHNTKVANPASIEVEPEQGTKQSVGFGLSGLKSLFAEHVGKWLLRVSDPKNPDLFLDLFLDTKQQAFEAADAFEPQPQSVLIILLVKDGSVPSSINVVQCLETPGTTSCM